MLSLGMLLARQIVEKCGHCRLDITNCTSKTEICRCFRRSSFFENAVFIPILEMVILILTFFVSKLLIYFLIIYCFFVSNCQLHYAASKPIYNKRDISVSRCLVSYSSHRVIMVFYSLLIIV